VCSVPISVESDQSTTIAEFELGREIGGKVQRKKRKREEESTGGRRKIQIG